MRAETIVLAGVLIVIAASGLGRAGTLADLDRELTALAAQVSKSVVTVTSEPAVVLKPPVVPAWPTGTVTASGVVYDRAGHIITVAGCVPPGRKVKVTLPDGKTVPAKVVGRDSASNLAVLTVDAEGLVPAKWGRSDDVKPGSVVVAVGSSFGMGPSVTFGLVSATGRSVAGHLDLIQITAPINPGDSGGLLANTRGELVGIITATFGRAPSSEWIEDILKDLPGKLKHWRPDMPRLPEPDWLDRFDPGKSFEQWQEDIEKRLKRLQRDRPSDRTQGRIEIRRFGPGQATAYCWQGALPGGVGSSVLVAPPAVAVKRFRMGSQGMNYALPADTVKAVVDQLIKHGKVARGWLGVMIEERADDAPGMVVAEVADDSPAAKAGIRAGDRIVAIDDVEVNSFAQLSRVIARKSPGLKVVVRLRRGDLWMTPTVVLSERPDAAGAEPGDVEVTVPLPPASADRERLQELKEKMRALQEEIEELEGSNR